jgi:low affinity Fe/Cu permease
MKNIYHKTEHWFEKLMEKALSIYGNSITFIVAIILAILFVCNKRFYTQNFHDIMRDLVLVITFLSFFIIQKAFNKYTRALHLKMNELVASHDNASNELVNVEEKSEAELKKLSENYKEIGNRSNDDAAQ